MLYLPDRAVDSHKQCLVRHRVGVLRTVSGRFVPNRWGWPGERQNGREFPEGVSGTPVKKVGLTT